MTIRDTDLFVAHRGGVDYKVTAAELKDLFVKKFPWEDQNNAVWHVKNASDPVKIMNGSGTFTAWDVTPTGDGYSWGPEKQITEIKPGEEVVFLSSINSVGLFQKNKGTWDFGELTDTSLVNSMEGMFQYCSNFNSYIGDWDTSNVTTFQFMFERAPLFNQDIGSWDTSNVVSMKHMFYGGFPPPTYSKAKHNFNQDISNWNTSKVKDFEGMFGGCNDFNWPIGKWDTSSATDMGAMFFYTNFDQDLSAWDVSKVESLGGIFNEGNANPSGIDGWDVSNVEYMGYFASENNEFNQDISKWDTSKVDDMNRAFYKSKAFNQDLSQWCVSLIPEEPSYFAYSASQWTEPKPVWGTCPRGEDKNP